MIGVVFAKVSSFQGLIWEAIGGVGGLDKDNERWKKRVMEDELRDPSNFLEWGST